mgnify:CR=1 FL=1
MKRLPLICLSLFISTAFSGCLFSKRSSGPKENPAIAASVEAKFKVRWLEQREAVLTAGGVTPGAAQAQAENEFRERYSYTSAARK